MTKKPILEISNLSKEFAINRSSEPYLSLRDSLSGVFRSGSKMERFKALDDISFDVQEGDTLGIIGKNGAGKSTLLKILSRITPPTSGKIIARGRIASLLEVGTGFHLELSGRENVYMNGSILGMRRKEIDRCFDAIVDFAGIEKFIDTPLKHYSSGMQLRLAFAVAAHLEPEILVIDEVLAVGDAEFQKKCLGKMQDVASQGRTVLFVSHNIASIKELCRKGIVLDKGKLIFSGSVEEAAHHYQLGATDGSTLRKDFHDTGNQNIQLEYIETSPPSGSEISVSSGVNAEICFSCFVENINLDCTIELRNIDETIVFHTGALVSVNNDSKTGIYKVSFKMPGYYLNAGRYSFKLIFGKNQREALFSVDYCYYFDVVNDVVLGTNSSVLPGIMRPNFNFEIDYEQI